MTAEVLLLIEKCADAVSWYAIDTGERLRTLQLPNYPHEFVTDAQMRTMWIGHYGVETSGHLGSGGHSLLQVDIASGKLIRTIDLQPFNRIHGLRMDAQDRLYALSEEKAALLVLPEPASDNAARCAVPVGGIKSHLFALSRDGRTAYCMNILSHTVTKVMPWDPVTPPLACHPGMKPEGCCLSDDERTLFVSNRWSNTLSAINTADMVVKKTVDSRDDPTRIYREDGANLLVTNYGEKSLSRVAQSTLEETSNLLLEARPIALSLHPSRPWAFVSQDDDRVAVVDLDTMRILRYFNTQREPDVSQVVIL